ncbi:EamA family transporter [Burkholderia sp. AU30198]|uniref:EamA family transporter n=1 Tax=Burkholderia sp. AU30198 TaxID=2879627 RepID=UPI001CF153E9|nr:EamA family transporter [Burkholderia sp. AU30198]MCA8296050.1 EamA family transporter [Burkholderia sp. AU30198]
MAPKDLLLALVVILAWGVNFVVIKVGLHGMPPMLLGALRFTLAAVPAVFFVRRPQIPWRLLVLYGATIQLGQFVFLFTGMYVGMPAGLASLVLQSQAFFTLVFAMLFLGEQLRMQNLVGLAIAAGGLVVIAAQGGRAMTLAGFLLTICSAAMWAFGNIVTKKVGRANLVSLVVWASLVPPVPFFLLSLWFEGPQRIATALAGLNGASIFAVVYLAFVATLLGYGLWSRLLSRYPTAQVAQFSLLVPIVGLASSALLLDEHLTRTQLIGTALVMGGLAVNVFGGKLMRRFAAS